MRKLLSTLLLFTLLLATNTTRATHMAGADITYRLLDTMTYEVTVWYYRDCRGVPATAPAAAVRCADGSGSSISLSLKRASISDITPICSKSSQPCSPENTRASKGTELHKFLDTVDFRSGKYKALLKCSNSCEVIFETGQCCRNGSINTGISGNFYTFAMVNPCIEGGNNSAQLSKNPRAFFCCNQPVFQNMGAVDPDETDSLSYSFAHPLRAFGASVSYTAPLNYKKPLKAYDPSGTGLTNPNSNPPLGIYLDAKTGDLIFTPTKCNEVTVAVIEVKEWRKDTSGKYQHIGTVRRDMQWWIETCPGNNPPVTKGPYHYSVCAGDSLCFTVTTDDKPKVLPGKPTPPKDTVRIGWNQGIPGATFTLSSDTNLHQSGKFCWAPVDSHARTLPYTFVVDAQDNSCPLYADHHRAYSITVKERAKAEIGLKKLTCNSFEIEGQPLFNTQATHQWILLDSKGRVLQDSSSASLQSSSTFISARARDTILVFKRGTYIIQYTVSNPPLRCPRTYFDTITFDPPSLFTVDLGRDTFVCQNTPLVLVPQIKNQSKNMIYAWSNGDTTANSTITFAPSDSGGRYRLLVTDTSTCGSSSDDIFVLKRKNLWTANIAGDTLCPGETIAYFQADSIPHWINPSDSLAGTVPMIDTSYIRWTRYGKTVGTSNRLTISSSGKYSLIVDDSLGCASQSTFDVLIKDSLTLGLGPKQNLCGAATIQLKASPIPNPSFDKSINYHWYTLDTNGAKNTISRARDTSLPFTGTQRFFVDVSVKQYGEICFNSDSVLVISDTLPKVVIDRSVLDKKLGGHIPPPFIHCVSDSDIELKGSHGSHIWSAKNSSVSGNIYSPSKAPIGSKFFIKLTATDGNGCKNTDSVEMQVDRAPSVSIHTSALDKSIPGHNPPPYMLCETDSDRVLTGSHFNSRFKGPGNSVLDSLFRPSKSPKNTPFYIVYTGEDWTGCAGKDSVQVEVQARPKLSRSNDTLFATKGLEYQWYDSLGKIAGATKQFFVPTKTSKYHAAVKLLCGTMLTDTMRVQIASLKKTKKSSFELYPNPAKDFVLVKIPANSGARISLITILGKTVHEEFSTLPQTRINTKNLSPGVYFVQIDLDGKKSSRRLVVE